MARFVLVCLGGALGSGARHLLSGWLAERLGHAFPYGTLAVNLIGQGVSVQVDAADVRAL